MQSQDVINLLKNKEKRMTKAKREIIDVFLNTNEFISVNDVKNKIKSTSDISTIYRNLESFCDIGFLEKIQKEDRRYYRLKEDYHTHNHHISCSVCGKQKILDFCPIVVFDKKVDGYDVIGHKFELLGICDDCKKEDEYDK